MALLDDAISLDPDNREDPMAKQPAGAPSSVDDPLKLDRGGLMAGNIATEVPGYEFGPGNKVITQEGFNPNQKMTPAEEKEYGKPGGAGQMGGLYQLQRIGRMAAAIKGLPEDAQAQILSNALGIKIKTKSQIAMETMLQKLYMQHAINAPDKARREARLQRQQDIMQDNRDQGAVANIDRSVEQMLKNDPTLNAALNDPDPALHFMGQKNLIQRMKNYHALIKQRDAIQKTLNERRAKRGEKIFGEEGFGEEPVTQTGTGNKASAGQTY